MSSVIRKSVMALTAVMVCSPAWASHIEVQTATISPTNPTEGQTMQLTVDTYAPGSNANWRSTRLEYRELSSGDPWQGICLDHEPDVSIPGGQVRQEVYDVSVPWAAPQALETRVMVFRNDDICQNQSSNGGYEPSDTLKIVEDGEREARMNIKVTKYFDDGNPSDVIVTRDCDTGLIPDQDQNVGDGETIEFIVTDHDPGELVCHITEAVPTGYDAEYYNVNTGEWSDEDCTFSDETASDFHCVIYNDVRYVEIEVTKDWIDEHPEFNNSTWARGKAECDNAYVLDDEYLEFHGDLATDIFRVKPSWTGETECWVREKIRDSSVISDTEDCQDIEVVLQDDVPDEPELTCTIVNTRVYEGIPTLNQYGLAVLALLMMGIGLVGFRRLS